MVWLNFLLCLVIILVAGTKLARYGDVIAEKTGLGGIWIGLVLLAAVASCLLVVMFRTSAALHTQFKDAKVEGTGIMGEHDGIWRYDEIHLKVQVVIEDESFREKIEKAVDMASKTCPVANSILASVILELDIIVG